MVWIFLRAKDVPTVATGGGQYCYLQIARSAIPRQHPPPLLREEKKNTTNAGVPAPTRATTATPPLLQHLLCLRRKYTHIHTKTFFFSTTSRYLEQTVLVGRHHPRVASGEYADETETDDLHLRRRLRRVAEHRRHLHQLRPLSFSFAVVVGLGLGF